MRLALPGDDAEPAGRDPCLEFLAQLGVGYVDESVGMARARRQHREQLDSFLRHGTERREQEHGEANDDREWRRRAWEAAVHGDSGGQKRTLSRISFGIRTKTSCVVPTTILAKVSLIRSCSPVKSFPFTSLPFVLTSVKVASSARTNRNACCVLTRLSSRTISQS